MTSAPLLIIVDDKRTDSFSFGPKQWNTSTLASWFNGTGQVPSNSSGPLGTIFMTFQGTSVAFFGATPSVSNDSQIMAVSIDGSQPTNTSYNDPNPPSYRQWYQSPTLTEGSHNISLNNLAGTSLDFAVVTVGNNTPLAGQVAIVDNEDPAITFKGNWQLSKEPSNSGQFSDGLPFHNSTHQSTTIGDSLTFQFTGQSAAIYGIFNWSNLGLITLTFTMDGSSLSHTFQVTSTTSQFQTHFGQQQNFQFFSYDFLLPGNHTLVVNVTDCVNQTFSFDYITFAPSFSTLATRPNLTDTASNNRSNSHSKLSAGAIVGIVIVVITILLGGALFWRRKRKSKHELIHPFLPGYDTETLPLNGHLSSGASIMSNGTIRNSFSSAYSPAYIVPADASLSASGTNEIFVAVDFARHLNPSTSGTNETFVAMDSARHSNPLTSLPSYDLHVDGDEINDVDGGEFSPPSYDESTRELVVRDPFAP